jgi:hypothetical protein
LKLMRSVRAAGESRIGIEISPNERNPFHVDAGIAPSRDSRYYRVLAAPNNTADRACPMAYSEQKAKLLRRPKISIRFVTQ